MDNTEIGLRVVVTGSGGLLGKTILEHAPKSWQIAGLTRDEMDIGDTESIESAFAKYQPNVVINCAAFTDVDGAESNPFGALLVNEVGPRLLSFAANQYDCKLIHISTDFVFDGGKPTPYIESDDTNPLSVYGETKLSGEQAVREVCENHLIVRTAWLYGDYGKNFPEIMRRLAERGPIKVVTDQTGSPTYAPHLAESIFSNIESGLQGTVHLAGQGVCTRQEWAHKLFEELQRDVQINDALTADFPTPAKRPKQSALITEREDTVKLPSWQSGVADYCRMLTKSNR
jgi:dTDP-4-dehydrorhamnose reductase